MKIFGVIFVFVLCHYCSGRSVTDEDSVVSVYTTQPTTATATASLGIYHQIANNIASRLTSPIYRFLGIDNNKTTTEKVDLNKNSIETLESSKPKVFVPTSEIPVTRDIEEVEAWNYKQDIKPEKFTLYSHLPVKENIERNSTDDENLIDDDEPFEFDDDDEEDDDDAEPSALVTYWKLFTTFVKLLWGGIVAKFKS